MPSNERYVLAAIVAVGCLLLVTCSQGQVTSTVEITVPPKDVKVTEEATAPAQVTAEPEPDSEPDCDYNGYRVGWVMDYSDPENILNVVFHPDSPFQYTSWDNQDYRDLVDQALMAFDFDTRIALWQEAEDILVTDYVAVIPVFHYDRNALLLPEIEAVYPPFGAPPFKHWRLPEGQTELRVRLSSEPPTLDVSTATDTMSHLVQHQLMEGLYEYDEKGRIQPAGAVSYTVSDDGLVYTIRLRKDATWSDGVPVTAQHYVDGITRLLEPETAAGYAWLMRLVKGAEAFNTGETNDPSTLGVRALEDYTLEITLVQAASYFDSILAFSTTYPVRLDVIERHGEQWAKTGNFVGNGAYVLTEWAHNNYVVLAKNPKYWGADDVSIERIEFRIIPDSADALAAYEQGELDLLGDGYPSEETERILKEMPDHLRRLPRPGTYYIGLNSVHPPTDNLNFRRALASAVDKQTVFNEQLEKPWRIVACGVIPPEIPGYQGCGNVGYEFNLQAAQSYLEAALDEMGIDDPADISINLWFNQGNEDVIEAFAEQWETNLGIKVNLVTMEWTDYLKALDQCKMP
jgi:oligopeptide transport system substrate-binding protein